MFMVIAVYSFRKFSTFCSWNPLMTPFNQLVNEMVDMDIQTLQRGGDTASSPADARDFSNFS
jgi:hypothetical protein